MYNEYISVIFIMPVYRVDLLNGKFYIGKIEGIDFKKRLREHQFRGASGSGLAVWYPEEDISTATIRVLGVETIGEPLDMLEDRLIREYIGDANCLNKNRGHRTLDEVKQQKKESYVKYMAEHPEKKVEYNASYRQRHLEERRIADAEHYEQNKEKILQRQTDYYNENKAKILAREKAKRDAMTTEEKQKKLDAMKVYREKKKAEKSLGE
jgi:hypothetical protein